MQSSRAQLTEIKSTFQIARAEPYNSSKYPQRATCHSFSIRAKKPGIWYRPCLNIIKTMAKFRLNPTVKRPKTTSDKVGLKATSTLSDPNSKAAIKPTAWASRISLTRVTYQTCLESLETKIWWQCPSKAHPQCRTSQSETPFTMRSQLISIHLVKIRRQISYVEAVELRARWKLNLGEIKTPKRDSYRQRS